MKDLEESFLYMGDEYKEEFLDYMLIKFAKHSDDSIYYDQKAMFAYFRKSFEEVKPQLLEERKKF